MVVTVLELGWHLRRRLSEVYAGRLKQCRLFGSYARGEADDESDLDVLIVLDRVDHYAAEIDRTGQLVSDLSLAHEVSISPVFISEWDWLHGDTTFLANVREEAVPA